MFGIVLWLYGIVAAMGLSVYVHPDSQGLLNGTMAHVHMFVLVGPYSRGGYMGWGQYRVDGQGAWTDTPALFDEHQVVQNDTMGGWPLGFNVVFGAPVLTATAASISYRLWIIDTFSAKSASPTFVQGSLPLRRVVVDPPSDQSIDISIFKAVAYEDGQDTHVHLVVDFYPPSQNYVASAQIKLPGSSAVWEPSGAVQQFEHFFDPVGGRLYSRYNLSWRLAGRVVPSLSYVVWARGGEVAVGQSGELELPVLSISPDAAFCTPASVEPLLSAMFASLGNDCSAYLALYAPDAQYFHQHDGYKTYSQLLANCQGYGRFCPKGTCSFMQDGQASVQAVNGQCHILAPYLWAEIPANHQVPGNLEPHTGWEYIIATATSASPVGYSMHLLAEVETSYSAAFNWATPEDTSSYHLTVALLNLTASNGECNTPIAPTLTQFFNTRGAKPDVWRQQGDAVVLAAGGYCHVCVPYAAEVNGQLHTGKIVFTLLPKAGAYITQNVIEFSS